MSSHQVVLHVAGNDGVGTALYGSKWDQPLVYTQPEGGENVPHSLDGWDLRARGELYEAQFDADSRLTRIHQRMVQTQGDPDADPPTDTVYFPPFDVTVEADADQTANPGLYVVKVDTLALPPNTEIDVNALDLPTLWIVTSFADPNMDLIDQATLVFGIKRGIASIT